jgi:hypothetical protein
MSESAFVNGPYKTLGINDNGSILSRANIDGTFFVFILLWEPYI